MHSSVDHIESWLRDRLTAGKLPSARAACKTLGISSRTWCAAVARLKSEGLIEPRRGLGILAGSPIAPPTRTTWLDIASKLTAEITAGIHSLSLPLEDPKQLAARFGVHPATVRRALSRLVAEGKLERSGRRWLLAKPRRARSSRGGIVLCIGGADSLGRLQIEGDREVDMWRELQINLSQFGLQPRSIGWNGSSVLDLDDVLGAVVSTWRIGEPELLFQQLSAHRIRTLVWTESATDQIARGSGKLHQALINTTDSSREAGKAMGRHLRKLGHRHIAFLSPFHAASWAKQRLEGLQAGFQGSVELHSLDIPSEWEVMESIRGELDSMDAGLAGHDLSWSVAPIHPTWELHQGRAYGKLASLLEPHWQAARSGPATAWVGASDLAAGLTMHWLAGQGLRVPHDLSVCGFDDTSLAIRMGLTSYRFDAAALSRVIVGHLLSSRLPAKLVSNPGSLVIRQSTGTPNDGGRPSAKS
jgi:DNA-binding transcriptional regulator YhcF (GntR family)